MDRGTVYLYAPGLLGPIPPQARSLVDVRPPHAALLEILGRGKAMNSQVPPADPEAGLCVLLGQSGDAEELPLGELLLLAEGRTAAEDETVFRASPVQLVPDRDQLLLFGPDSLELSRNEAADCIQALNQTYVDDGLTFQAHTPHDWSLRVSGHPRLQTVSLARVAGGPMVDGLPAGEDSREWIARLNEIQMLLFSLPVNQQRQMNGQATINGVWIWGGGKLQALEGKAWSRVVGDTPLVAGLARAAGTAWQPLGRKAEEIPDDGASLVYFDAMPAATDGERFMAWQGELDAVCSAWLAPLVRRVQQGRLQSLVLDAGSGTRWEYRRHHRWRFWRRHGRLADHLLVREDT